MPILIVTKLPKTMLDRIADKNQTQPIMKNINAYLSNRLQLAAVSNGKCVSFVSLAFVSKAQQAGSVVALPVGMMVSVKSAIAAMVAKSRISVALRKWHTRFSIARLRGSSS